MSYRTESDSLGEIQIENDKYWSIHTQRAIDNFRVSNYTVPLNLIHAIALVKIAACTSNHELGFIEATKYKAIISACQDIIEGKLDSQFPLDALQGGAGTSTNMNLNEVIANRALEILGFDKGNYTEIHPIETVNLHQSTNDVYPTALKIAAIKQLKKLSDKASMLQGAFQKKENEFADISIIGRTEMQEAVPMTLGSQFASFADAIARDRWRTFKCEERLRMVNIGGTAIGTGLTAPRAYIFLVIEKIREVTGLGLARAENAVENTANNDTFVEVSGMLDAFAVNLIKIAKDIRFLHYSGEIVLPSVQAGSSIMPGKVNPVILESVISTGYKISNNHQLISRTVAEGTLQINEFMPLIAQCLLESLELLTNIAIMFTEHINGIVADRDVCLEHFENSMMIITGFLPYIGYDKAGLLIKQFKEPENTERNFKKYLTNILGEELVNKVLSPFNLMSLGYRQ